MGIEQKNKVFNHKFRGKDLRNGRWIYGSYHKHLPYTPNFNYTPDESEYKHLLIMDGSSDWNMPRYLKIIEVDGATLEQFTGELDAEGNEIYRGILK